MNDNIVISKAVISPKMLKNIEFLQNGENGVIEEYIESCESITNLLFKVGEEADDSVEKNNLYALLKSHNELRQMLKDFRAPKMI